MDIGLFQIIPRVEGVPDHTAIEQALADVEFAERIGFESVWIAEHHGGGIGLGSAPSVYAAAIASRTSRIRIGYAVAVVPLHHPLRLAEEISWVDHLSRGRVTVGVGPGFSETEFAMMGVPLEERHARLEEGLAIVKRALANGEVAPRPYTRPYPPFHRACSSAESVRRAVAEGSPILLGTKPVAELAPLIALIPEGHEVSVLRRAEELDYAELCELGVDRVIAWFKPGDHRSMTQARDACEPAAETAAFR